MASLNDMTDRDRFTFTWRIENFTMCPQKIGYCIESPPFVIDALNKTMWSLQLYPKGQSSVYRGEFVSLFLCRISKDEEPEEMTVSFNIELVTQYSKSFEERTEEFVFSKSNRHGYERFVPLKSLLGNNGRLLPNDNLTVLCSVGWRKETSEKLIVAGEIPASHVNNFYASERNFTVISGSELPAEQRLDRLTLSTRIHVIRSEEKLLIQDFETITLDDPFVEETDVCGKRTLMLRCYLYNDWDGDGCVRIDILRMDEQFNQMLMKCKISLLDRNGLVDEYLEEEHIFGEDYEIWSFPDFIHLRTIRDHASEILDDGTLTLQFECFISYAEGKKEEDHLKINDEVVSNSLIQDFENLFEDKVVTDVTLVSEGFELPVHKSVICARSPVFRAMFTNDTEEKRTGVVRISDIDADTLRNLKRFMYGCELPDLKSKDVMKLYSAAGRFQIHKLKYWCAGSLKYSLGLLNVCDVLVLADLVKDDKLLRFIHGFLLKCSLDVFESDYWTNLMENNLELAAETMRKVMIAQASL